SSRSRLRWLRAKTDPLAYAPGADPELQPRPKGARYGAGRARALEPGVGHRRWRGYGSIDAQSTALANLIFDGPTVLWYHRVGALRYASAAPNPASLSAHATKRRVLRACIFNFCSTSIPAAAAATPIPSSVDTLVGIP